MQAIALWVIPGLTEWMESLPGAVAIELIGALPQGAGHGRAGGHAHAVRLRVQDR